MVGWDRARGRDVWWGGTGPEGELTWEDAEVAIIGHIVEDSVVVRARCIHYRGHAGHVDRAVRRELICRGADA